MMSLSDYIYSSIFFNVASRVCWHMSYFVSCSALSRVVRKELSADGGLCLCRGFISNMFVRISYVPFALSLCLSVSF